jgi:hypothetical protein
LSVPRVSIDDPESSSARTMPDPLTRELDRAQNIPAKPRKISSAQFSL